MRKLILSLLIAAATPAFGQGQVSLLHFSATTGVQPQVGDCLDILAINSSGVTATDPGTGACGGSGSGVSTVSVVSANGFAGTVATATTTPAITISTSITGLLEGNGTAIAAATSSNILSLWTGTCSASTFLRGDGACAATNAGTVTSVGFSDASTTPIYTIGSTPVTGSGTITQTLISQTANQVFAAPSGSAGQPSFRALVSADIPTLNQNTTGNATTATTATNLSGTTVGSLPYQSASGTTSYLSDVATGSVLVSGGVNTAFSWSSTPAFSGANITANTVPAASVTSGTFGGATAAVFPAALTATKIIVSATAAPTLGLYAPAANTVGLSANSVLMAAWGSTVATISGCGTAGTVVANATTGTFIVGTGAATCTFVFTINGATGLAAAHGWHMDVDDVTAKIHCTNTGSAVTTTGSALCNSTVTTGDVIAFAATPY